nr:immunoglobulin light chain junction region [Macaca mulatta]MOY09366.1 immunoglobulin light chain junction region [Macaca mulatta]
DYFCSSYAGSNTWVF